MATRSDDRNWIRQAFLLPEGTSIGDSNKNRRFYSSAEMKYTDTTLGGNYSINNPHQFTRFTDLARRNRFSPAKDMGRYYSEAIDDPADRIHMRGGVAEYNGLTTFFANMYNPNTGSLARTGETKGLLFSVARLAGFITAAPLLPFVYTGRFIRFVQDKPYSKYYYLKPTMELYWNAVNNILNMISVNMGLTAPAETKDYEFVQATDKNGQPIEGAKVARPKGGPGLNASDFAQFKKILPDIFEADGGIDIYAVANRAQRIRNKQYLNEMNGLEVVRSKDDLFKVAAKTASASNIGEVTKPTLTNALDEYAKSTRAKQVSDNETDDVGTWEGDSFIDNLKANITDGLEWITFKVNHERQVSESFSNSTKTIDLAEMLNSTSSGARDAKVSMAGGNIGNDIISGAVETTIGAASDIAGGFLSGFGLSGLAVMAGQAFTDIPEQFDRSVSQLPSMNYTMELRTPYGNKLSIFMNLYVPLAMILAAALPLSAGKQSHVSPFLWEIYSKGRVQSRLSVIDALQISRGVGNVGWSDDDLPVGIDISFSVKDLSTVMHMPIDTSHGPFDDDTVFSDYMAVLGSMGLTEQIYGIDRLKNNMSHIMESFEDYLSPAYHASWVSMSIPGRVLSALARGTDRA